MFLKSSFEVYSLRALVTLAVYIHMCILCLKKRLLSWCDDISYLKQCFSIKSSKMNWESFILALQLP